MPDSIHYQQVSPETGDKPHNGRRFSSAPPRCTRPLSLSDSVQVSIAILAMMISAIAGFAAGVCISTATPKQIETEWGLGSLRQGDDGTAGMKIHELESLIQDCGETPAEARGKGCRFEVMLQMWIPAACYDEEHSEKFLRDGQWKWYYDIDRLHEMPDEIMRRGEHQLSFMRENYHRRHCAYTWEIQMRAMQDQRPLLDELLSFKHVHHCNNVLLSPPHSTNLSRPVGVETHAGYGRCASYQAWLRELPG